MADPKKVAGGLVNFGVIAAFTGFAAFPFAWMLITTFKQTRDLLDPAHNPFVYHAPPTLEHLRVLFQDTLFLHWVGNTLFVGVLVVLVTRLKLNAFIALIIAALVAGGGAVLLGQEVNDAAGKLVPYSLLGVAKSLQDGLAATLGGIAAVLGLGTMLGQLLAKSGGAEVLAKKFASLFGPARIQWCVIALAMAEEARRKGTGVASAEFLPGTRLVRAFNAINYDDLRSEAHRKGERVAIPLAGDDAQALAIAERLVRDAGFDPVVVGPLSRAREFDVGTKVYTKLLTAPQLRKELGLEAER